MVLVQAANEAVAKKTQANPVATRFNMPRFPRLHKAEVKSSTAYDPTTEEPLPAYKPLTNQKIHPAFH
jgi:hypothetical protein